MTLMSAFRLGIHNSLLIGMMKVSKNALLSSHTRLSHRSPAHRIKENKKILRGRRNRNPDRHGFITKSPNCGPRLVPRWHWPHLHRFQFDNLASASTRHWHFARVRCLALCRTAHLCGDYPAARVRSGEFLGGCGDCMYVRCCMLGSEYSL